MACSKCLDFLDKNREMRKKLFVCSFCQQTWMRSSRGSTIFWTRLNDEEDIRAAENGYPILVGEPGGISRAAKIPKPKSIVYPRTGTRG